MQIKPNSLVATITVLLFMPVLLAGCDATAGAGRDISKAGQALTQSAQQNKGY